MKHLLLALLLLLLTPVARAQTAPTPARPVVYRYCALVVAEGRFSFPDGLQLDYGQAAPGAVADPEMAEMAKNIGGSRSVIDVLNYLSRHGWELLNVNTVQTRGRKSSLDAYTSYIDSETRYLLRQPKP